MSRYRILICVAATLSATLWAYACGDGTTEPPTPPPDPPRPATVAVTPATTQLTALGDTVQLSAEVRDQNGQVMAGAAVTWSSSATSIATVSGSGLVTAAGNGTATITARAGGASGTAVVTVMQSPDSVAVLPEEATIAALGDTLRLAAEAFDANGRAVAGAEFSWESSDAAVATVDGSGLVTAAGNGTATITATAGSASGSATVSVAQRVSSVTVSPAADTLVEGDTLHLSAEAVDGNGHAVAESEFEWASSDTLVARVDDSGLVTGAAAGEADITATSWGVTGRAQVTVVVTVPTTVTVTPDSVVFTAIGQTEQLSAEVRDQIGRAMVGVAVSWSSSDTTVAAVDSAGLVTAVGTGVTTVTATVGEVSGKAFVTVMQSAGSVIVSPGADTIAPGDTMRLLAEAYDENGHPVESAQFSWSSSDVSVARVDGPGLVHGVAEGTATITATAGDARGASEITVENPDRAALVALYEATDGPNWVNNEGWLTDAPLGEWYGVGTDGFGRVLSLNLGGQWDSERGEWIPHGLQGSIPTELGSLTNLRYLRLNNNALTGPIPTELGNLSNLESLQLYNNALTGPIPTELGSLTALRYLSLGGNELTGQVPTELGNPSNLESLYLNNNALTGPIPTELGSLTALRYLSLGRNELTGQVPTELGNPSNLESLSLNNNALTGPIPTELGSLTALRYLSLGGNELTGPVPTELGNLSNLENLSLGNNALTGPLPRSLLQLVNLTWLYFRGNDGLCAPGTAEFAAWIEGIERSEAPFCNEADREALELIFETAGGSGWTQSDGWLATPVLEEWHGVTADSLGRVETLDLTRNGLEGELSPAIGNLDRMTQLRIGANALSGRLPLSLAKLSLVEFHYNDTELCAPTEESFQEWLSAIPSHGGTALECLSVRGILKTLYEATDGPNWVNNEGWLTDAPLGEWYGVDTDGFGRVLSLNLGGQWDSERGEWIPHGLQGSIPTELGSLTALRYLRLNNNALTGPIPTELGSLTALRYLFLGGNELTGPVPTELGNLSNLESLQLYNNALTGPIPTELGSLTALRYLFLGGNELTGQVPTELGNLSNLESLQLNNNALTGPIPTELGSLTALRYLFLGGNELTGQVPTELGNPSNLESLSLNNNALTGPIPTELGSLTALRYLSLGGNELTGPVPTELGNLSNLENLSLGNNALTGPLPRSLLQLVNLTWLYFRGNDGLCAPGTAEFAAWIEGIERSEAPFCNEADREALELIFETAGGSGWTQSDGWLATPVLEEWHGVTADSLGRVETLDLTRNGLEGELSPAIGNLDRMTQLRIGANALSGRLPLSLAKLSLVEFHYNDTELCAPTEESFQEWLSAIPSHGGTALECLSVRGILKTLYEATDGPNWVNNEGWLTDAPLGEWYGVDTDGFGRVLSLNLGGQWDSERGEWIPHGLQGSIPTELGSLTNLRYLRLNNNALTGPIPTELGSLTALRYLRLNNNALTGPIPTELGNLSNLESLQLYNNALTGPIPTELGNLSNLESLQLYNNALTGPIPTELGSLTALRYLFLGGNELTGQVPTELGNLSNLESLQLNNNALTGPIPTELGSLTALRYLFLGGNELTGQVPTELGNPSNLESLSLNNNALTGPIPTELGSLTALRYLSLGGNELTGPVPTELGNLSNLENLSLGNNALTGPLPRSLLQLVNLTWLYFRGNDGLCAPGTAEFAAWIEGIERSEAPFCNEADREALELIFETAGGSGWTKSDGWRATQALGEWYGVTADFLGRVEALDLSGNRLAGKVPNWSRGALAHLTELRIGGNADLAGRLPLSLAGFSLRVLHYAGTGLCAPADAAFARWLNAISSHQGAGVECAPLSDHEILEALYDATGGPDWTNSENWLTEAPLSEWHGVRVDDQERVVGLSLFANRLRGAIPAELGKLTELRRLVLARNYSGLTGPIPAGLSNLTNLEELYLYSNALEGAIPPELGNLPALVTLSLLSNALEGAIPPELGNLANLRRLFLHDNDLEGAIPLELGNLANLQYLFLAGNGLTGSIPSTLSNLASLRGLSLVRNGLTGPLPAKLGGLSELARLYLGHNDLTGSVPQEFGALTGLRELAFSGNIDMSGALPSSLTNLRSLETLEATGTQLCAPSDPRFLEWLDQLPSPRVALCEGEPAAAYLVQPVQSRAFPVPLVAGEEALLRVFVTTAQDNEERLPPVRASFHLDGALVHVADMPGKPGPIPTDVGEGSLAESANRVIPGEVVRPGLEMVIEIDPDGTLDAGLGVAKRIPQTGRMPVDVREMPVFDLTVIPFLWSTDPDSTILEQTAGMAGDPEGHELLQDTRTLLPIGEMDVKAHEPVASSSNDAYAIIGETRAIRAMEGGSGYYMGMMSGPVTGAAGLGGGPVSFAVPGSGVIAHEMGHNMSLSHAPCGGAAGPDPAFPYMDGATGAWGYDFRDGGRLVGPEEKDLMGYCGPDGISDYHFTKALNFRLDDEGDAGAALVAEAATSLLLWGGVDSTGTPYIEPSFVVDAPPALPASAGEYRLTGRTEGGAELFSLSFAMPEEPDGDGSSSFAFVLPVQPRWQGNLGSITLSGPGGSVTLDAESNRPVAILRDPRTRQVRGILRDLPPPIQVTRDAAGRAAGPGVEVIFSRGIPDAAAWRR